MLTSDLITSIQARAAIPNAQVTFSTDDFYRFIDEETKSKLIPLILSNMEEYYVRDYQYNITSGVKSYLIPPRAIATKLRDVQLISSANPDVIIPIERLDVSDLYTSSATNRRILIQKCGFYLKGNSVILYPTPTVTQDILNLSYYIRPSTPVDPTVCAQITAIDPTLNQITVSALPTNISTLTPVDLVKSTAGFECSAIDRTITSIAGTVLTMSSSLPNDLSIGDWVCQATQTCVVQVPAELIPLLSQYCVVRVLEAQGDLQALQAAMSELQKLETNANMLIAPRVSGKLKRVVNTKGIARFV